MIRNYALITKDLSDRLKEVEGKLSDLYKAINNLTKKG